MITKPESNSSFAHTALLVVGALAILCLGALAAVLLLPDRQGTASAEPAIPPGVSLTSWFENGKGGQHVLQIAEGNAPPAGVRVAGTVATDTNCDPDAQGLSHCHNRIDLGNGSSITVIHTHTMSRHPCLTPGQRLSITRLNANWVVAYDVQAPRTN
jgi:hypothetical protein